MKSVKNMTLDQVKRIQLNNYCGKHCKRTGKQFDYEANGYKEAIDARYWELVTRSVDVQLKQARNMPDNTDMSINTAQTEKTSVTADLISKEIESLDIQLSVLKAFNRWRFISNSIQYYM